jgi:type IV pilus assembly protein PilP
MYNKANKSNMKIRKLKTTLSGIASSDHGVLTSQADGRRGIAEAIKIGMIFFALLGLQACQDKQMQDLRDFVTNAYKDKKPEIEPLPEIKPYQKFEYSAFDSEDPFNLENIVTSRANGTASGESPDANRPREPLEEFPLDALKMVGTLTQKDQPYIIVKTSEGTALRATIGNYMGQNDGKIKEIVPEEQRVVLTELVLDTAGRWINRDVEITIDEDE